MSMCWRSIPFDTIGRFRPRRDDPHIPALWALTRGVQAGVFAPPPPVPALDFAGLQKQVSEAREELQKLKPDEVNGLAGKDMVFQLRDNKLPFTAEGFLLSFSLPNFYFHATTAYDILRSKGVPLGKRDFLGRLRMKS